MRMQRNANIKCALLFLFKQCLWREKKTTKKPLSKQSEALQSKIDRQDRQHIVGKDCLSRSCCHCTGLFAQLPAELLLVRCGSNHRLRIFPGTLIHGVCPQAVCQRGRVQCFVAVITDEILTSSQANVALRLAQTAEQCAVSGWLAWTDTRMFAVCVLF